MFLDRQLSIKRFTAAVSSVINLIPSDIGRPFHHIATKLEEDNLHADAAQVLDSSVAKERQVRSTNGRWYLCRTIPYRTQDNRGRRCGHDLNRHDRAETSRVRGGGEKSRRGNRRHRARAIGGARWQAQRGRRQRRFLPAVSGGERRRRWRNPFSSWAIASGTFPHCASCWKRFCRKMAKSKISSSSMTFQKLAEKE